MTEKRITVISGQVFGKVDWVTADGKEVGMFLKTSDRDSTRCVISGPDVARMVENGSLQKGMMCTAHGEFTARCFQRRDTSVWQAELVVKSQRVVAESLREGRMRAAIYCNIKGVVLHWDEKMAQVKTFINYDIPGMPKTITCTLNLRHLLNNMTPDGKERFLEAMKMHREYVASALAEVSCYKSLKEGTMIPSISLLPTDFKLQG